MKFKHRVTADQQQIIFDALMVAHRHHTLLAQSFMALADAPTSAHHRAHAAQIEPLLDAAPFVTRLTAQIDYDL